MIARVNSLGLDPEVLAPDSVLRLQNLQCLSYEFLAAPEFSTRLTKIIMARTCSAWAGPLRWRRVWRRYGIRMKG